MKRKKSLTAVIAMTIIIICLFAVSCNSNTLASDASSNTSGRSSSTIINSLMAAKNKFEDNAFVSSKIENKSNSEASSTVSTQKKETASPASSSNSSGESTSTVKPTRTPKPTATSKPTEDTSKPASTPTPIPKPTSTPKPSNICPICGDRELQADGTCDMLHLYTGYGYQIYENGTVYVVCSTCGQKWPRSNYSDPSDWVHGHAYACYNKANEEYMYCNYCLKEWPESKWHEMYKGEYCNRDCAIASGYYCPNCEAALYVDGCHNCGYKEICSECGKEESGNCLKQYCTVCAAHIGHGADSHCPVCSSTEHTSHPTPTPVPTCPTCGSTAHATHPQETKPAATPTPTPTPVATPKPTEAPKCGAVGHTADGTCSVCGSTYSAPKCPICASTEHTTHPAPGGGIIIPEQGNNEGNGGDAVYEE